VSTDLASRFPHLGIRASAGTGKTFALAIRFIGLLAAGEMPDRILATTFTRKAAREILQRVLTQLAESTLSVSKADELAKHLKVAKLPPKRCGELLARVVERLHRLRIGTLDSFFGSFAGSFSLDLGLPPGWKLVDEADDAQTRADALQDMLEAEGAEAGARTLRLLHRGELRSTLHEEVLRLTTQLHALYLEAPRGAWRAPAPTGRLESARIDAALSVIEGFALEGTQPPAARDADCARVRAGEWHAFLTKGLAAAVLEGRPKYNRFELTPEIIAAYRPLVAHARACVLEQLAEQTSATRTLLEAFDRHYQRGQRDARALRFDDVARALGNPDNPLPLDDIYFRLDTRIAHVLLDEFQDTSLGQWNVLAPFVGEIAAHLDGSRSLLCVGDVKQAIYGWRGGVAEVFDAVGRLANVHWTDMAESRRSSRAVIDLVNRVFGELRTNGHLASHASSVARWSTGFQTHETAMQDLPGRVRVLETPAAGETDDSGVTAARERTLRHAAAQIAEISRQDGRASIGVLTRANASVGRLIYELRRLGVPASEEGGNVLVDSPAVMLVLSCLTLADHPGDSIARFHVMTSPLGEIVGLGLSADASRTAVLATEVRRAVSDRGYGVTVSGWCRRLAEYCDARDARRLQQLVDLAFEWDDSPTLRPSDFVTFVRTRKMDDPQPAAVRVMTVHQSKGLEFDVVVLPDLDRSMIQTRFEVLVHRPDAVAPPIRVSRAPDTLERSLDPNLDAMVREQHDRLLRESLCLFYVALTRARGDVLAIVGPPSDVKGATAPTYAGVLRAALGLERSERGVLFEHATTPVGASQSAPGPAPIASERATEPVTLDGVRLRDEPGPRTRGLPRLSPSGAEGGAKVRLADRMRLDTAGSLARGALVHAWFQTIEWIDDGVPDDAALLEIADGLAFPRESATRVMAEFRTMLEAPEIHTLLTRDDGSRERSVSVSRERPFAWRDGDVLWTGKFDRLVVQRGGGEPHAEVIDFKTDAISSDGPRRVTDRIAFYQPQMEAYRRAAAHATRVALTSVRVRVAFVRAGIVVDVRPTPS